MGHDRFFTRSFRFVQSFPCNRSFFSGICFFCRRLFCRFSRLCSHFSFRSRFLCRRRGLFRGFFRSRGLCFCFGFVRSLFRRLGYRLLFQTFRTVFRRRFELFGRLLCRVLRAYHFFRRRFQLICKYYSILPRFLKRRSGLSPGLCILVSLGLRFFGGLRFSTSLCLCLFAFLCLRFGLFSSLSLRFFARLSFGTGEHFFELLELFRQIRYAFVYVLRFLSNLFLELRRTLFGGCFRGHFRRHFCKLFRSGRACLLIGEPRRDIFELFLLLAQAFNLGGNLLSLLPRGLKRPVDLDLPQLRLKRLLLVLPLLHLGTRHLFRLRLFRKRVLTFGKLRHLHQVTDLGLHLLYLFCKFIDLLSRILQFFLQLRGLFTPLFAVRKHRLIYLFNGALHFVFSQPLQFGKQSFQEAFLGLFNHLLYLFLRSRNILFGTGQRLQCLFVRFGLRLPRRRSSLFARLCQLGLKLSHRLINVPEFLLHQLRSQALGTAVYPHFHHFAARLLRAAQFGRKVVAHYDHEFQQRHPVGLYLRQIDHGVATPCTSLNLRRRRIRNFFKVPVVYAEMQFLRRKPEVVSRDVLQWQRRIRRQRESTLFRQHKSHFRPAVFGDAHRVRHRRVCVAVGIGKGDAPFPRHGVAKRESPTNFSPALFLRFMFAIRQR